MSWFSFDNTTGETRPLGTSESRSTAQQSPTLPNVPYIKVEIAATGVVADESWKRPIVAFFRRDPNGWSLVGLEREPDLQVAATGSNR